jgi:two-component system, response regulator
MGYMANKYILLVEDNADDEALSIRALKKNGVFNEVVVARNGVEATDFLFGTGTYAAEGLRDLPAVVLLDLKLPKLDGVEVLRRIRGQSRTRLIPVVVLTSSIEETDLTKCYSLGANSYLRKPVDFDHFMEAVRQLGTYWLILNQTPPSTKEIA